MKTLIVHPRDPSTNFLEVVYYGLPDLTVVRGGIGIKEMNELIQSHDRMIALGHGTPSGLLSVGQFKDSMFAISENNVKHLYNKVQNIYIWCNADQFIQRWGLYSPLYTGMFVSEVGEAYMMGMDTVTPADVNGSNLSFAAILNRCLEQSWLKWDDDIQESVESQYWDNRNEVCKYNAMRLYHR